MPDFHQFLQTPEMASRSGFLAITGDIAELAGHRVHFFDHEPLAAVKHIRGQARKCLVLVKENIVTWEPVGPATIYQQLMLFLNSNKSV